MLISTNDPNYCDSVIRPVVDSYLTATATGTPTSAIFPSLETLATGGVPLASIPIASNSFGPFTNLSVSTAKTSDVIVPSLETLSTSIPPNLTYLFGGTDYVNSNLSVEIPQASFASLNAATNVKHSDVIVPSTITLSASIGPFADAVALIPVMNCWLNATSPKVNNLHTLMKLMAEPPVIEVDMGGSLYDYKEVPFGGQAFIDHTFIVIDEDFTKILGKASGSTGAFTRRFFVKGDKVHVLAIPTNATDNIIPFRGIDISGV